jgi:hypothetical protein
MNFEKKMEKANMPYSDIYRLKLRLWQLLIMSLELIDPKLYTPEFR